MQRHRRPVPLRRRLLFFAVALATPVVLTTCGDIDRPAPALHEPSLASDDSDEPSDEKLPPIIIATSDETICLSDSTLEFDDRIDLGPQTIFVNTCRSAVGGWTARPSPNWTFLSVSPLSGHGGYDGDSVTVTVHWPSVTPKTMYPVEVTFEGSQNVVTLDLTVYRDEPERPFLCIDWPYSTQSPPIPWDEEDDAPVRYLTIENCGAGTYMMDWTASASEPWVLFGATSGSLAAGQSEIVEVTIDWEHADWDATVSVNSNFGWPYSRTLEITVCPVSRMSILQPNSSTVVMAGDRIPWETHSVGCSSPYEILVSLYKGDQRLFYQDSDTGFDFWSWARTLGHGTGSDYRIHYCASVCAWSDYFTIIEPETWIEIWRPGEREGGFWGAAQHVVGTTREMRWFTHNAGDFVSVDLLLDEVVVGRIVDRTENDGQCEWVVTDFGMGRDKYKVRIFDSDDPDHYGISRGFTIRP